MSNEVKEVIREIKKDTPIDLEELKGALLELMLSGTIDDKLSRVVTYNQREMLMFDVYREIGMIELAYDPHRYVVSDWGRRWLDAYRRS